MKAGQKVIIHWSKDLAKAMAYVMLGRCELLEDLYIAGEFDVKGIICDIQYALPEAMRLLEEFEKSQEELRNQREKHWQISYLNVRSMKSSNGHREDVKADNFIMDADMFGLGETWLEQDTKVDFDGFSSHFANFGTGKGVAGYTKMDLISQPEAVSNETYSAISMKTKDFNIIFLYLSSNYKKDSLFSLLDRWIEKDVPTAVLGDVNENFRLKKAAFTKMMNTRGFHQLIKESTCDSGSIIDHLYIDDLMKKKEISTSIEACYYRDVYFSQK